MENEQRWWKSGMAGVVGIALATIVVHLATGWRYGFDRDELMALEDARHLAWGYVQYPPMTAFFGWVALKLFGTSLVGFRFFAALVQAVALVLTGLMARELGGGKWAQITAALAGVPFCLGGGALMQYIAFDYVCWVLVAWGMVRLLGSGPENGKWKIEKGKEEEGGMKPPVQEGKCGAWWLVIGAGIGLGMLAKYTMGLLVAGVVVGVLATPTRRWLRSGWLWGGVLLAAVIFLPNLLWEWKRNFISLEFLRFVHERDVQTGVTDGFWLGQLELMMLALPLAVAGLWFYFTGDRGSKSSGIEPETPRAKPARGAPEKKSSQLPVDSSQFRRGETQDPPSEPFAKGAQGKPEGGAAEESPGAGATTAPGAPRGIYAVLGWMYVVPLALLVALKGRDYYLAPAYPMLYAAGAVWMERKIGGKEVRRQHARIEEIPGSHIEPGAPGSEEENRNWKMENGKWGWQQWMRRAMWVALLVDAAVAAAVTLPIAPVNSPWWKTAAQRDIVFPEEIGWEEFTQSVARVWQELPSEERARGAILAGNYGEVGALNLYGEKWGLPQAISGVNSSWERGYGQHAPETLVVAGYPRWFLEQHFASCEVHGRVWNRYGVANEETIENPEIFVCRGLKGNWEEFWRAARRFA